MTQLIRYYLTDRTAYKKENNGLVFRFNTDDGEDPSHVLKFASSEWTDSEFHPYMDICYLIIEDRPPCDERITIGYDENGELQYQDINADTYIMNDKSTHGGEEHLLVGNSGWAGEARTLMDFDISTISQYLELVDDTDSVYLDTYYEGAEMAAPYNDPIQIDRTLSVYQILKSWNEQYANGVDRTKGTKWAKDLMQKGDDYASEQTGSKVQIKENSHTGPKYFNITELFTTWMNDKQLDKGVLLKDSNHPKIPGYFLKFASKSNVDETKRPRLIICKKQATCEPVDNAPGLVTDPETLCVSKENVTLNICVAKNGGCTADDPVEHGYYRGVTAFWDDDHNMKSFCKCCVDKETTKKVIPMDCSGENAKTDKDYDWERDYIDTCQCQMCSTVSEERKKRDVPSKTRLLLRSALKSLLKK